MFWLFVREKAEELGVDLIDNLLEVLRTVLELDAVHIKDKKLVRIVVYPVLITLVQTGNVVDPDALFVLASPLLDLADEVRDRAAEVDQQVRRVHEGHHEVEKVRIVLEVPGGHEAHTVEVRREDARVFVDCAVLDDDLVKL